MDEPNRTDTQITPSVRRDLVEASAARTAELVGALSSLDDASLESPSELPGWSLLTIACHLRFGAEALLRMTAEALERHPVAFYPEGRATQRPRTLELRSGEHPGDVVRSLGSTSEQLQVAWDRLTDGEWRVPVVEPDDNPDLGRVDLFTLPLLRLTELEVHGTDLAVGLSDWSETFVRVALRTRLHRLNVRRSNHRAYDRHVEGSWLLSATGGPSFRIEVRGSAVEARQADAGEPAQATIVASSRDLLALLLGRPLSAPPRLLGDVTLARRFNDAFPGP